MDFDCVAVFVDDHPLHSSSGLVESRSDISITDFPIWGDRCSGSFEHVVIAARAWGQGAPRVGISFYAHKIAHLVVYKANAVEK
ncbi:hypothetical protein AFA91_29605 [Mycolicibacterium goodii]|uniref:Uncharacterized protein n=1 Tax=Mycolicibacterium goodii TaxID=134601 RepID=A0A0K0XDB5_MYCGD|nr:hypothetical protein AFA91_29605 [Mycolicibacterium goodii]